MISPSDRALAIELIQEANQNGARLAPACNESCDSSKSSLDMGYYLVKRASERLFFYRLYMIIDLFSR